MQKWHLWKSWSYSFLSNAQAIFWIQADGCNLETWLWTNTFLLLCWFQWLRLALSNRPKRVDVSLPSPGHWNTSRFRNIVLPSRLEFRSLDKVQKPSDSVCHAIFRTLQVLQAVICWRWSSHGNDSVLSINLRACSVVYPCSIFFCPWVSIESSANFGYALQESHLQAFMCE
jgi:hypothetical protein